MQLFLVVNYLIMDFVGCFYDFSVFSLLPFLFFKNLAFGYPGLWSSVPHFPTGRRLLLNIPPTQEDVLTNDNSLQNASNNEFLFSGKFPTNHSTNNCGPNKNMSCAENSLLTDSRQIFQVSCHSDLLLLLCRYELKACSYVFVFSLFFIFHPNFFTAYKF